MHIASSAIHMHHSMHARTDTDTLTHSRWDRKIMAGPSAPMQSQYAENRSAVEHACMHAPLLVCAGTVAVVQHSPEMDAAGVLCHSLPPSLQRSTAITGGEVV